MKILLDSCVSPTAALALAEKGHQVEWVGGWESDPGDSALVEFAIQGGWVIATIDKDFGDLIHLGQTDPCSIIRLVGFRAAAQGPALLSLVEKYEDQLVVGALITAEAWRVRIRRLRDA